MEGRIITFYSYKGGVGRSMALANVATQLAAWGKKVLLIDWDFEAPGLEKYFPQIISKDLQKDGILELLTNQRTDWTNTIIQCLENSNGRLHLIKSGRKDENYFQKVQSFSFDKFFVQEKGGQFIEKLRARWKESYDFIFVDSRTGISDIGGVCTVQLPDVLVLLFTATQQGIDGISKVGQNVNKSLSQLPITRKRILRLLIPSRIDVISEQDLADKWFKIFATQLSKLCSDFIPQNNVEKSRLFFEKVAIPAIPKYSFGEEVIINQRDTSGLLDSYQKLSAILLNGLRDIDIFLESNDYVQDILSDEIEVKRHVRKGRKVVNVFVSYDANDLSTINKFVQSIQSNLNYDYIENNLYFRFLSVSTMPIGAEWNKEIQNRINQADVFLFLIGTRLEKHSLEEFEMARSRFKSEGKPKILVFQKQLPTAEKTILLRNFEISLLKENNWPSYYNNNEELEFKITNFFNNFIDSSRFLFVDPATLLSPNGAANPIVYIGREDELKEIRKRLDRSGQLLLVNADGGRV